MATSECEATQTKPSPSSALSRSSHLALEGLSTDFSIDRSACEVRGEGGGGEGAVAKATARRGGNGVGGDGALAKARWRRRDAEGAARRGGVAPSRESSAGRKAQKWPSARRPSARAGRPSARRPAEREGRSAHLLRAYHIHVKLRGRPAATARGGRARQPGRERLRRILAVHVPRTDVHT
eukprot:3322669-Prymnesium_polylepis.1